MKIVQKSDGPIYKPARQTLNGETPWTCHGYQPGNQRIPILDKREAQTGKRLWVCFLAKAIILPQFFGCQRFFLVDLCQKNEPFGGLGQRVGMDYVDGPGCLALILSQRGPG
jgi:hypothetical protein